MLLEYLGRDLGSFSRRFGRSVEFGVGKKFRTKCERKDLIVYVEFCNENLKSFISWCGVSKKFSFA